MFLLLVIYYIAYWKLFVKLKFSGWKCLLPVYNNYLLCKKLEINKIIIIIYLIINVIYVFLTILYLILFLILFVFVPFLQLFVLSGSFQIIDWENFVLWIIMYGIIIIIYKFIRCYVFCELGLKLKKSKMCSIILGLFNFVGVIVWGFDNSIYENN